MGSANAAAIINLRIMISLEFILRRNRLFLKRSGFSTPYRFEPFRGPECGLTPRALQARFLRLRRKCLMGGPTYPVRVFLAGMPKPAYAVIASSLSGDRRSPFFTLACITGSAARPDIAEKPFIRTKDCV
jgi:hypothetical protein